MTRAERPGTRPGTDGAHIRHQRRDRDEQTHHATAEALPRRGRLHHGLDRVAAAGRDHRAGRHGHRGTEPRARAAATTPRRRRHPGDREGRHGRDREHPGRRGPVDRRPEGLRRRSRGGVVRRAGLLQDRRRSGTTPHRRGDHRHPGSSRADNNFTVDATEDAARSPTPTSRSTRSSSSCPPPVTCSTPTSRPRSSATSRPAAATPASTPRPTPSTTGPGTASSSAPTSPTTRGHPAPRPSRSRTRRTRPPQDLPAPLDAHRRVVQLPDQPARPSRARAGVAGRDAPTPRAAAPWAPTTRSPGARTTTAAAPGTPAWATPRRPTPTRRFLGHILGGIQTAAGVVDGRLQATLTPASRRSPWTSNTSNPMELDHRRRRPGVLHRPQRRGADHQAERQRR